MQFYDLDYEHKSVIPFGENKKNVAIGGRDSLRACWGKLLQAPEAKGF